MLDRVLAIRHHLCICALFGVLIGELILVKCGMGPVGAARMAAIDIWYGVLAGLILVVGFSRAICAANGWPYYQHNAFFQAQTATFLVIGLLFVRPTVILIRWRRDVCRQPGRHRVRRAAAEGPASTPSRAARCAGPAVRWRCLRGVRPSREDGGPAPPTRAAILPIPHRIARQIPRAPPR